MEDEDVDSPSVTLKVKKKHLHTCAHYHGRLATEICHYTSDRLPPPVFPPRAHLPPGRGSAGAREGQRARPAAPERKMCCTKYVAAAHGAEETPAGASSSSATAPPALGGAPGQQGIPGNPLISNPLLASSYGVSTKRWCNCRHGTAISQFFWLSLTNTVSDPARSK